MLAGVIHLVLTADHFKESTVMGVGFLGSALAEFALAGAVLVRPRRLVYVAVIGVATVLIGLYAYNVMLGLPFSESAAHGGVVEGSHVGDAPHSTDGEHGSGQAEAGQVEGGHHSDGLVLGQGEPVEALGAATKLSELAAIGLAVGLLTRRRIRATS